MDDNRYEVVPYQGPLPSASQDVVVLNGIKYTRVNGVPTAPSRSGVMPRNPWLLLPIGVVAVAVVGTGVWCFIIALLAVVHAVEAHALEVGVGIVVLFVAMLMLLSAWTKFRVAGMRRY